MVLAEAIIKGLPFISTATAGIATDLPKECGITIENENEDQLVAAIYHMLNKQERLNTASIKENSRFFHAQEIGKNLLAIYDRCLHSHI